MRTDLINSYNVSFCREVKKLSQNYPEILPYLGLCHEKKCGHVDQGPVVQSMVSLMSSLRGQLLSVL